MNYFHTPFFSKLTAAALATLFISALSGCHTSAQEKVVLKDQKDKVSYTIGINIGNSMKHDNLDIDSQLLAAGLRDALTGNKPQLTDQEMQAVMLAFQQDMQTKSQQAAAALGTKNAKEGEDFLTANKNKPGVKVLSSGLQYQVLQSGTGKTPKSTDTVTTNYRGTLIDGTEFDSSYKRGQPATFPVNGVIPGWTEALQLMKEGDKWQLFVPAKLAYGERGAGGQIGPNSALIFEVELISVK